MTDTAAPAVLSADADVAANMAATAPSESKRLGRNLSVLAGSQAVTWALSIVWTLVVPRLLGPHEMGILVTAYAITGILGILLGQGTKLYLAREIVAQPAEAPSLVGTAIVLRVLLLPVFLIGVVLYAHFAHYGANATTVLYLAAATVFLTFLAEPLQAAFQAKERMEYLAYASVLDETLQSVLGIGLALIGFRAGGLTACALVVAGLMLVLNVRWIRPLLHIDLRTSGARVRSLVSGSLAYWAFGLFFMLYLWIDSTMLSLIAGPEVVAWYGVPTKLFTALMFVPVIFATAWFPRLVTAFGVGPERLRDEARRPTELVVILSLPICVATALTAGPLIRVLYGASYANAAPVLAILALVVPFMYLNIMLNQVLVAAQRQVAWTWVMAGATVINPLLNFGLIKLCQSRYDNGAIGAAISLLITEILIVAVGIVVVDRRLLGGSSVWRLGRAGLAALGMWGVMTVVGPYGFVVALVAGSLAFVAAALLLGVPTADDLELVRVGTARFRPRRRVQKGGGGGEGHDGGAA